MYIRFRGSKVAGSSREAAQPLAYLSVVVAVLAMVAAGPLSAADRIFVFGNASHDAADFELYTSLAARLKPYGEVQVLVSEMADKNWQEIPEGGSPWHEYACYIPGPWVYYPHPKIAPFINAQFVQANRKLLLEKSAILQRLGLFALFESNDAHFLPEAFFQKYPELRGPRVDHPRRSRQEAFSMCLDLPQSREMVEWMMSEIRRNVPLLRAVDEGANDAGQGLCWGEAIYSGPNGPSHCRNLTAGQRVRNLSEAVHRGAVKGGGDILFYWNNVNFWRNELEVVRPLLPPDTYLQRYDPAFLHVGTRVWGNDPFKGVIDPLEIITRMERYHSPGCRFLVTGCSGPYSRYEETPEAMAKLLDIVENCIKEPTSSLSQRLEKLKKFAVLWGGEKNSEKVFESLYDMNRAFELKDELAGGYAQYSNLYCGVSMRHLTRPLVIKPENLTKEEEAYFLPYVFNPRENEARMDYIDFHGGRMSGTGEWEDRGLRRALSMAVRAGRTLQGLEGAPEGEFLKKMGLSVRMWASEVRSIHNFYHAQLIRDKYKDILEGPKRIPTKVDNWDGDPGNLEWNEIMRDELDNTNELIAMLEDGGLELAARAKDPRYEDTFLIGPDLVGQLKKKAKIMREHWLDVQDYLAPPHK
ncbi:MAG TPA: hypothetical protein VM123_06205 [archaeon]|nr:hypothetical protein [archaeon]